MKFGEEYRLRSCSLCSQRSWEFETPGAELTQWAEFNRGSAREPCVLEGERISQFPPSADWFILGFNSTADGMSSGLVFRVGKCTYSIRY